MAWLCYAGAMEMVERGTRPATAGVTRGRALALALLAVLIAELVLFIAPKGFSGGPSDDQRYFDIAQGWFLHGADAGTTHWSLRLPLIVAIDGVFHLLGPGIAALLVVPRLFYALFVGVTAAGVARWAGERVYGWWLALVLASPVLHEMATSCFPEMVELSFVACSLAACLAARRAEAAGARIAWMAASGLALGCAILTRETAAFLAIIYLHWALRRPAMARGHYGVLAVAAALPIAGDIGWLWSLTGDWLYRLHIDEHHVLIPSDHMRGEVFHGSPFLNLRLASRWVPSGPTRIHWALNPLGDFLLDPAFGFVLLGALLTRLPALSGRPQVRVPRGAGRLLFAIGIASYLIVTWVFMLRPQPRYYLPVIAAGQIGLAWRLALMRGRAELARRAAWLGGAILLAGALVILVTRDAGWQAKMLVPYMRAHPGRYVSTDAHVAGRARTPAEEAGVAPPTLGEDAPPGGYRVRLFESDALETGKPIPPDPRYRRVAALDQPMPVLIHWLMPRHHDMLLIEQRVR